MLCAIHCFLLSGFTQLMPLLCPALLLTMQMAFQEGSFPNLRRIV